MRFNILGKTGLYVSEPCLGTMTFGGKGFWEVVGKLGEREVESIIIGAKNKDQLAGQPRGRRGEARARAREAPRRRERAPARIARVDGLAGLRAARLPTTR